MPYRTKIGMNCLCALQVRDKVNEAVRLSFETDPSFIQRSLATLNAEAVGQCKKRDHVAAVAALCKLFERARVKNLIHPEMHICYRFRPITSLA